MKVVLICLVIFIAFMMYCLCVNSSRISRLEEKYLSEKSKK